MILVDKKCSWALFFAAVKLPLRGKLFSAVLLNLLLVNALVGQLKTDGPVYVEPGELARIAVTGLEGLNDPKIECFPPNTSWEAVRRLDGSPTILFYTKKEGTYNFVVAGNKDNKTILVLHQVTVGRAPPPGPGPKPPPVPDEGGKYTKDLRAPYLVNPDNNSLIKLISVYESMASQASTMMSFKQMHDALKSATEMSVGPTALKGVRDAVAVILQTDLANRNAVKYDPVATKAIFNELATSLKPLLEK